MWGGLALAVMLPEERREPLKIRAGKQLMFDILFRESEQGA